MPMLDINKTLVCIFSKYTKILLTVSRPSVHTSPNTPAKPMLFSNSMLKLSGLFFACHIPTIKRSTCNAPSSLKALLEGGSA